MYTQKKIFIGSGGPILSHLYVTSVVSCTFYIYYGSIYSNSRPKFTHGPDSSKLANKENVHKASTSKTKEEQK